MINLPLGVDINNLINDLRIWSWEAADILLEYSQLLKNKNAVNILTNNNHKDPVTIADLKVNKIIIQRINESYKNVKWQILSEENVKVDSNNFFKDTNWLWILDPLDGTKDFIQGTGNYAMHLALNYKQRPYIGVVLIPERNELWITDGEKAWCEDRNGYSTKFNFAKNKSLTDMTLLTSKNHRNKVLGKLIDKVKFKDIVLMGSIGCKVASLIRGEGDIYISLSLPGHSSPKDWDFAAPEAILRAAGGALTNLENQNIHYNQSKFEQGGIIVATKNKSNHKKLCESLKEIIKENDLYPLNS